MTWAPASASRELQKGAATACSTAMTISPSSGSIFFFSVGTGHAQHVLGEVRQNEIGRDRRHLIEPGLAEFAFDVIFFRKAETAMGLYAGVGGIPGGIGRQHLGHIGLSAAIEPGLVFAGGLPHH